MKIRDQMTQGKEEKNKEAVIKILKCVNFLTRQKLAVTENTEKIIKFVKHFAVIKMELVSPENALLFMFYQVLMENFITIHFPNLRQNVANFPNCKGGGGS